MGALFGVTASVRALALVAPDNQSLGSRPLSLVR